MRSDFRLVGLSKARSATLHFLDTDKTTFWAPLAMTEERFQKLWDYCKGNWKDKKIAEVEHKGFFSDGTPIKPTVIGVREWDL